MEKARYYGDRLPNCDVCSSQGRTSTALYDAATRMGPWGYLCQPCFDTYAYGLGMGRGQKLELVNPTQS